MLHFLSVSIFRTVLREAYIPNDNLEMIAWIFSILFAKDGSIRKCSSEHNIEEEEDILAWPE
jgi:hypothetical protein